MTASEVLPSTFWLADALWSTSNGDIIGGGTTKTNTFVLSKLYNQKNTQKYFVLFLGL